MQYKINTLQDILLQHEGVDLEFKKAAGRDGRGEVPQSLWSTYSAMANTQGGLVILGVADDSTITGIGDPEHVIKTLWDALNNRQVISGNLLQERDVQTTEIAGKSVILLHIPRATRLQRPVFVGDNPFKGSYRRNYEGDYLCDDGAVRRMIADAEQESPDGHLLDHFTLADLDPESLAAYRQEFRAAKPGHPWTGYDDREFLRCLGGWTLDRESQREGLTLAGLLMFGRLTAIHEAVPAYQVDYQDRTAITDRIRWNDRLTTDGTWSGNLYDFSRRVYLKLTDGLKVPFRLEAHGRRVDATPVHEALREALVNALIHADYHGRIGILVVRQADGYSFRNPGTLRLPLDLLYRGGISDCRNQHLQKMFQLIGIGEHAGSGIPKILHAWQQQHWRYPLIQENIEIEISTCILPMISLFPPAVIEHLETRFGADFQQLSADQRIVLATASVEGTVTNQRLQQLTSTHPSDITTMLQTLVDRGFLRRYGVKRGAYYVINENKPEPYINVGLFDTPPDHPTLAPDHPTLAPDHPTLAPDHPTLAPDHPTLAPDIQERNLITEIREQSKSSSRHIEEAILVICRDRFANVGEIAASLQRTPETLSRHYISRMLRDGLLVRRYPDQPRHPEQAYKAAPQPAEGSL